MTVFGDLAPDAPLEGQTLSALMTRIGIKPEATRVALHRLRADGWIISEKSGRTSAHSLTSKGRQDSAAARPRIYGPLDEARLSAKVVVVPENGPPLDPASYLTIAPNVHMINADTAAPDGALILDAHAFPAWIGSVLEPEPLRTGYRDLWTALRGVERDMSALQKLAPIDRAAVRVLVVHAWRRLALKHPVLPRAAHTKDWRGHDCRTTVLKVLEDLPRPARDALKPT
ncbi:MAG: PaaX family transcriptional regulator C-terminal domain-containing protein [Pseudomonadota bacterium]